MKKITLALALLASVALNVQAQKLGFVNGDDIVADDSTIVFHETKDVLGKKLETGDLKVKNYTNGGLNCSTRLNLLENSLNGNARICMGTNCREISSWPFSFTFNLAAGDEAYLLYEILRPNYGSMLTEFTVEGGGETHTIYIKFVHADPAGIDDVVADGKFTVFNTQGNIVARGISASDVEDLQPGLYIVRGDNSRQARKVLVRN